MTSRMLTEPYDQRTDAERDFHGHMMMFGSAGYPIRKVGRVWIWEDFWGVKGSPTTYKTKKAASEAVERFIHVLCDKAAGRWEEYRAEPCPECGAIRKVSGIPDAHFCATSR